jgi:putative ABC transport system ATP-binding protein
VSPPSSKRRSGRQKRRPAIEARKLSKVYGEGKTAVRALSRVDLAVEPGQMVAIMGPSGSGKSTLLHLMGALETPSAGDVRVGGRSFAGLDDDELTLVRRESIGFVFQFYNLIPTLNAEENVVLPALIGGRRDSLERARELLELVGLRDRGAHLPSELSGGEQQRVSIARALLMEPELVLADEPTGNLDSRSEADVLDVLRGLNRDRGHTIVMVTHDPGVASIAGRIVFLRDGRLAGEIAGGSRKRVIDSLAKMETDGDRPRRRRRNAPKK